MDDKTIQRKLNQLTKLANELDEEARKRWDEGGLFFEADGVFHIMSGDSDDGATARQSFIKFSAKGYCSMGAGAW